MFRSRRDLTFALYVVVLTAALGRSLFGLFTDALHSDLNSYIVLIPFVSLYFFYSNRHEFTNDRRSSPAWALIPLVMGIGAFLFTLGRFGADLSPNDRNTFMV